jgi:DnaJ-domain-containing protein 1
VRFARATVLLRALLFIAAAFAILALLRWLRPPPSRRPGLTAEQARMILGVGPDATREEIRAAYRRRISQAHPDKGGSAEAAAQVNAARDALLKR